MKKNTIFILFTVMVLTLLAFAGGCTNSAKETASAKRNVVDMAGRTVSVPVSPKKVATMQGPTYEMVFMLGAKNQIGLIRSDHATGYPLALLTNPDLKNYPSISGVSNQSPVNVEQFISKGVDLVVYWNIAQELEKFDKAGIPAVAINWSSFEPKNLEETLMDEKKKLAVLADILGDNAPKRYKEWEAYLDNTVKFIEARTSTIPEDKRPRVYWGNTWGTNIVSTYPINPLQYEIGLCGGKLVSVEKGGQFPEITKEQLLAWGPEVIIVDNHGRDPEKVIEQLKTNADWASLPAVRNGRIYRNPAGVFFMDKGTSRAVYYFWLAKQLHPDLFADVDLIKELKYYYNTFYDYDLSTAEAEKVLAGWVEG